MSDRSPEEGPRRTALRERRRKNRRRKVAIGALVVVVAAAAGAGARWLTQGSDGGDDPALDSAPAAGEDDLTSVLFFGSDGEGARWLTLVSHDPEGERASIIYVPPHTAVEVPGRGLLGVGEAYASGGSDLLLLSAEILLGIEIDAGVEIPERDASVFLGAIAPLVVNVPLDVRVEAGENQARVLFAEGLRQLAASDLVDFLYVTGLEGDEVELGARHLAFWDALLDTFAGRPGALGEAFRSSALGIETTADIDVVAAFLRALAALEEPQRTLAILPVRQVGVGGGELYQADAGEVEEFLEGALGGAFRPADLVRVRVLNGNGVPGIGQEVAELLVGKGFQIVLTGNAPRLDYRRTLVVTHDPSPAGEAAARRARRLLGVGRVQVSGQEQGIVDLTIVVGRDFLRVHRSNS